MTRGTHRHGLENQWRSPVTAILAVLLAIQFLTSYAECLAALPSEEGRINIREGGNTYRIPYFRNYPLSTRNDNVRNVVIAIHGAGGGAEDQYDRMKAAACLPGAAPCPRLTTTLIIAPEFMQESDLAGFGLSTDGLFWSDNGWKFGDLSLSTDSHPRADRVSSYTVMDNIVEFLATGGNFPNLRKITIAGHSAGGQYVNRYAAISPIEVTIAGSGVDMKYVVANPSTYLYFTNERVYPSTTDTFFEPHPLWASLCPASKCCPGEECASITYDNYYFGLGNPSSYNTYLTNVVGAIGVEGIKSRYRNKTVAYLLGRFDNDPCAEGLDNVCGARLEGRTRLERGLIYYNYIGHALGTEVYDSHRLETIENVCHSSNQIYRSNLGRKHIFGITAVAEAPEIVAPMGTVEWADHTYQWYATPGASEYRIDVTDTGGGAGSFTQDVSPDEAGCPHGGLCSKRILRAVSEGTWTVSARIVTTWLASVSASFQVGAPSAVMAHSPTGSTVDHTPTFKWDAAEGATRYQLAVFNPSGINYVHVFSAQDANCDCGTSAPLCITGGQPPSCAVTAGPMLNDGQYWWMVRPGNGAGMGPWTPVQAFTVGTPALLSGGEYTIKLRSSGKCLEHDRSRDNNVQLRGCRGESDQKWGLSGSMSIANLKTVNLNTNMCLEADDSGGSDMTNGGNVQIADCLGASSSGDDHQEWSIEVAGDGYYRLTVRSSGKCLDADNFDNNDMKECGNVQVWDCKDPATRNTDNQEWRIEPVNADEFRHPGRPSTYPVPDIEVNGQDRTVTVRRGESVTVSFSLTNWHTIGPECDWWFFQTSPAGVFYWTPHGWTTAPQPALQGSIFDFPPPLVELPVPTGGIATGTYWLYFAIDGNPDGFLSLNHLYLDGVRVNVTP